MASAKALSFVQDLLHTADVDINGQRPWDLQLHSPTMVDALLRSGSLGLGEAYMAGLWDCHQLDEFFSRVLRAHLEDQIKPLNAAWLALKARLLNGQTAQRAWQVGEVHYDLGNGFYRAMLGSSMAYSCGLWDEAQGLDEAQFNKLDLICRKLGLQAGMTLLDIGCGWGSLMKHAATHYGVRCVGVTISKEQAQWGADNCKGLPVEFRLQDYRSLNGRFDRVASVGMFEHVGRKNYRTFFEVARRNLVEGGLFLLHTIGGNICDLPPEPWTGKYIFPNGEIPCLNQVARAAQGYFVIEDVHNFGADYDPTLMAWHANFERAWPQFKHRFPAHFYRMWRYYLLSCAGSFRARSNQLWQLVLSPQGVEHGYHRVESVAHSH